MTLEELRSELIRHRRGPQPDWKRIEELWRGLSEIAERILMSVASEARCVAQEWDNRLDCEIGLPGGGFVAEMISLRELTEHRIREAGDRLRRKAAGEDVRLRNERTAPLRIGLSR